MKIIKNLFILFFVAVINYMTPNLKIATASNLNNYEYEVSYCDKIYKFKSSDFELNLTDVQIKNYHSVETLKRLEKLNFQKDEILKYVFPEVDLILEKLNINFGVSEKPDEVFVLKNKCEISFKEGKKGNFVDRENFYNEIYKKIKNKETNIKINLKIKDYKNTNSARDLFKEKSSFTTNFETSSPQRKNNIKVALSQFDGLVLNEGEVLSFNQTTGKRNEENGYQKAKIISNGTFVEDFGGGVCQVSTTLYNACLLAGLEIIESNSHSLPVSYIEPSFDAMVSTGSSDLKIRNNSGGQIIFTTSYENDLCKVKIFGKKNKFKITRHSEKVGIIKAEKDVIETDYERFGVIDLNIGEEKRLSFSKDGYYSRGYLNFYNEKGELVETRKIRENKYNATKGVIIKREK